MKVLLELLKPGMVTAEDVYSMNGQLLVPIGTSLTGAMLHQMKIHSIRSVRINDNPENTTPIIPATGTDLESGISGFTSDVSEEVREIRAENVKEYKKAYSQGVNQFEVAINNLVTKNMDLDVNTILDQTLSVLSPEGRHSNILEMLAFMKEYNTSTYAHCVNVSLLCNMLAHWLGYDEQDCRMAAACGMFHDVGKLTLPEEILKRPGPLSEEERKLVNTHCEKGYELLEKCSVDETVKLSALMHHEFCDGTGYPHNLKAEEIDRFAKLVTICNIYDAMTSERPYRKPISPFAVIEYFEGIGLSKFDTRPILVFLENTVNTYLKSPVRLSDGAVGQVVFINKGRLGRPVVKSGKQFIDLSQEPDLRIEEILPII